MIVSTKMPRILKVNLKSLLNFSDFLSVLYLLIFISSQLLDSSKRMRIDLGTTFTRLFATPEYMTCSGLYLNILSLSPLYLI
jgi:hypothetical protein